MKNKKAKMRAKTASLGASTSGLLRAGIVLFTALVSLSDHANAALTTTCSAGQYLILDTDSPHLQQGVCATCPRGK